MAQEKNRIGLGGNRIQEGGDDSTLPDDFELGLQVRMDHAPNRVEHRQSDGSPDHELQPDRKVFHINLLKALDTCLA